MINYSLLFIDQVTGTSVNTREYAMLIAESEMISSKFAFVGLDFSREISQD